MYCSEMDSLRKRILNCLELEGPSRSCGTKRRRLRPEAAGPATVVLRGRRPGWDPSLPTPRPGFSRHTHCPGCFGQGEGLDKQWQKNPVRVDSGGGLNVLTNDRQRITYCGSLGCVVVNLGDVLRSFQHSLI